MRYKAVIFDLDGTLLNTLQDIATSANIALKACGKEPISLDRYRYLVGEGAQKLMSEALGEDKDNKALAEKLFQLFKNDYANRWYETSKPYDGIEDLLEKLHQNGVKLAVLSNKPHDFVKECVAKFFPNIPFEYVAGEQPSHPRKPDPAGAFVALDALKLATKDVCFVGDTKTDMQTAANTGLAGFGVSWGFRTKEELVKHGAKNVFEHPRELKKYLLH